ncbi:Tat pathway signal sequence domain protein [Streptomyces tendae]|uniref:Tat pathway signal sequence domain protein n=1 Tax=Streptomyces tendae TaxID=1932 RepID=UPI00364DD932
MTGIGPVEPGEDTRVRDAPPPRPRGRLALRYERHRRTVLTSGAVLVALAGGGYLYANRSQPQPAPPPPYPSQAVDLVYVAPATGSPGATAGAYSFTVLLSVRSGPPVTVTRLTQPYDGLSVTSSPAAPFQTKSHSARKIIVTLRVTECEKAPRNPGLPFLDVTLRNARAIEAHSFILGARYAQDLSRALEVACGNDSR